MDNADDAAVVFKNGGELLGVDVGRLPGAEVALLLVAGAVESSTELLVNGNRVEVGNELVKFDARVADVVGRLPDSTLR